jgi:hypothetical protein
MPSTQGNFEVIVNVPAASGGNTFVVNYTISCYPTGSCSPAGAGSFNVVLPSGNNSILIPQSPANLGFVEPSCNQVIITGTIRCQTSVTGTPFSLTTNLNLNCKNYKLECINPNGCTGFNTDTICPTCTELTGTECPLDFQNDFWSGYYPVNNVNVPVKNDKIPTGSIFNLCYDSLTKINQELGIGGPTASWSISLNDELDPPSNPSDPCCWECERRTFTFQESVLSPNAGGALPKYLPSNGGLNGTYPSIHYTSCDAECKDVTPTITCFGTRTFVYSDPAINGITLCMRRGSYTVLNAVVGTDVIISPPVSGRCAIPDQYIP